MKLLFLCLFPLLALAAGCVKVVQEKPPTAYMPFYSTNSPGTKFSILPSSVQRTVVSQAGSAEIKDINKLAGASREIYEVTFTNPGVNPSLFIAEDGTLVNEVAVRPVTRSRITTSTADTISGAGAPGDLGGTDVGGAASAGGTTQMSAVSTLPLPVQMAITNQNPSGTIIDVRTNDVKLYDIYFKDQGSESHMVVTEDGVVFREAPGR